MHVPRLFLYILLVNIFTFNSCKKSEEENIRDVFNNYNQSLITSNGDEFASYIDSNTIHYYYKILECAKGCDSIEIAQKRFYDQLVILLSRHAIDKQLLMSMNTGSEFISYIISHDLSNMVRLSSDIELTKVKYNLNSAIGECKTKAGNLNIYFIREGENWKINMLYTAKDVFNYMDELWKEKTDREKTSIIESSLYEYNGIEMDPDIWQKAFSP